MNFTYTENPGYWDIVEGVYRACSWYYRPDNWNGYSFPASFFADIRKYFYFSLSEAMPIFYWSIIFTLLRYAFEIFLCKPLISYLNIDKKSDREKFPESAWKFVAYSFLWAYCSYLVIFSGRYDYFTNPYVIWDDWSIGMPVQEDIKLMYFVECGFYLHSIYATLYMDTVRKDFAVMLLHHVITLALIVFSYATRYHKTGLLVIFVHDVTDILLEFTKCNVYLKNRNGKFYAIHEHISNIGFAAFTLAWYLFRLYWFPLKIVYTTAVVSVHKAYFRGAGLYAFFNTLLCTLLILDIYWFYFILLFLYKVVTGQLKEIADTREFEEESGEQKSEEKKKVK